MVDYSDYSDDEIRDIKTQIKTDTDTDTDTADSNLLFESGYLNGLLYGFRRYLDISPSYINKSDIINILFGGGQNE